MTIGRRNLMLGGLGAGLGVAAGPRKAAARGEPELPQPFSTMASCPTGESTRQQAFRKQRTRRHSRVLPFFLPPGDYTTSKLTLKSGTETEGVPGKSVLHYNGGSTLISIENGTNIRLTGLTLWSEAKPLDGGVPLIVESVKGLNPV